MGAEKRLRFEVNKCRNCEACRELVGFSCLVFPEMFNMVDQQRETGEEATTAELNKLADMCNFCGACPCLDIRAAILEHKTEQADINGLPLRIRALENVEQIGKISQSFPRAMNFVLQNKWARKLLCKTVGIHEQRQAPIISKESFPKWYKKRSPSKRNPSKRKLAYFVGCSARFLFPEIGKALVNVFERNGCEVYYPPQQCCGMPAFLEGDRKKTLALAGFNLDRLVETIENGYDIVCSCPTCGYMLKKIINTGSGFLSGQAENVTEKEGYLKIAKEQDPMVTDGHDYYYVSEKVMRYVLRDNDYFGSLDRKKRSLVSENTYDAGEYLMMMHEKGELDGVLNPVSAKISYFPPCHQREQRIGQPYHRLINLIAGVAAQTVDGDYCCGNGGIMGFKKSFYRHSLRIGGRLVTKLRSAEPDIISTDCLSCRMQLNQMTAYNVRHPLEILEESYAADQRTLD